MLFELKMYEFLQYVLSCVWLLWRVIMFVTSTVTCCYMMLQLFHYYVMFIPLVFGLFQIQDYCYCWSCYILLQLWNIYVCHMVNICTFSFTYQAVELVVVSSIFTLLYRILPKIFFLNCSINFVLLLVCETLK